MSPRLWRRTEIRLHFPVPPMFASPLYSVPRCFFLQFHKLPTFSLHPEDYFTVKKNTSKHQKVPLQSDSELKLDWRRVPMLHLQQWFPSLATYLSHLQRLDASLRPGQTKDLRNRIIREPVSGIRLLLNLSRGSHCAAKVENHCFTEHLVIFFTSEHSKETHPPNGWCWNPNTISSLSKGTGAGMSSWMGQQQCLSHFNVHKNHLRMLLKCRF